MDDATQAGLAPMQFALIPPLRWVGRTDGPIRRIFGLMPLKGGSYVGYWGFALDFVPVPQKTRFAWKRGKKDTRTDLCIRTIDDPRFKSMFSASPENYSFTHIPAYKTPTLNQLLKIASCTSELARRDFERVNSVDDIVGMFEERSQMDIQGWPLSMYVQTDIAWGLALVATGDSKRGEEHITKFCDQFRLRRDDPVLLRAEQLALNLAGKVSN